jgi:hypothetical protein
MKKVLFLMFTLVLLSALSFGQALQNYQVGGVFSAPPYAGYSLKTTTAVGGAGAASVTIDNCYANTAGFGGKKFNPIFVNNQVTILDSASETVTVTAVTAPGSTGSCSFSATFTGAHPAGASIMSGTFGLAEAVADAATNGGVVRVGADWGGSASTVTSLTKGATNVFVQSLLSTGETFYGWNGTAYVAIPGPTVGITANGAAFVPFVNSELLTLSTGGTTTDTTANLLPANSIILGVVGRVTTTITTGCTGWQMGDPTTAGRFTASNVTLAAGTTDVGKVQLTTGVASATTGLFQTSAAKVRVTCATAAPGAGAVRITVFGYTLTPPAS